MKFIHCADIHLGSKMETNLSTKKANERKNELLLTFEHMVNYAKLNEIKAVLISGDLFDVFGVSNSTKNFVIDKIKESPEIDFLYLYGNHEKGYEDFYNIKLPSNLKFFSDTWSKYEYDGITISGVLLTKENFKGVYDSLRLEPDRFNIVMMHGQVSRSDTDDSINLLRLADKGIDYLALGHVHSYTDDVLDRRGVYVYPGCLEGRGFDECGDKGFVVLDVDDGNCTYKLEKIAKRRLHEVKVDITGLVTLSQLQNAINVELKGISSADLVRVVLIGKYKTDTEKNLIFLEKALSAQFYFVKVFDKSSLDIDFAEYKNEISLKGEFFRIVMADKDLSNEEKEKIITYGFKALAGEVVE